MFAYCTLVMIYTDLNSPVLISLSLCFFKMLQWRYLLRHQKGKSLSNLIPDMRRVLFILGSENNYMSASPCKKATIIAILPSIC